MTSLSDLAIRYIERVVNQRDLTAVDDMVAPDYRGSGPEWPRTMGELRRFYEDQIRERPDWHIDVREVVELGDSVVVRAHARGTVVSCEGKECKALDWLTHYRFHDGRIAEINLLTVLARPATGDDRRAPDDAPHEPGASD